MTRRKLSGKFKLSAAQLVTERGVILTQACWDPELAENVLRRWICEATATPATAFPGNRQQRADLADIEALKKEVAKFKAESDFLKNGEPCSPFAQAQ